MKKKKKQPLYIMIFGIFIIVILLTEERNIHKNVNNISKENNIKEKEISKKISMLFETEDGEYLESNNSNWNLENYNFNNKLSYCENGSSLSWNEEKKTIDWSGNLTDKCYIYFNIKAPTLADYIISLYNSENEGENGLYKHDGRGTYGTLEAGSGTGDDAVWENSYRFSGASNVVNNYVCFGSNATNCPSENLYRIIGVFDGQVKLIKATKALTSLLGEDGSFTTGYTWSGFNLEDNTWSHSLLNQYNLNSGYTPQNGETQVEYGFLYTIGPTWANMIANHTWKVGGNTWANIYTNSKGVRSVYNSEIVRSGLDGEYIPSASNEEKRYGEVEYTNKVGLLYISDYMYASNPNNVYQPWSNLIGYSTNYTNFGLVASDNWLLTSSTEWNITRYSDNYKISGLLYNNGKLDVDYVTNPSSVRPVFYLKDTVKKKEGSGSALKPFRLS